MKCSLAVFANDVIVDERTNRVSVIKALEDLQAAYLPAPLPVGTALFHLAKDESEPARAEIIVAITLDGEVIGTQPMSVQFLAASGRHRLIVQIAGVIIPRPGALRFGVIHNGNDLGGWIIAVSLQADLKVGIAESKKQGA